MKKLIIYFIIAAMLAIMLFSGCTGGNVTHTPPDTEVETGEPSPTEAKSSPETVPTISPLLDQSDKPLDAYDFPELTGMQLSVNAANEMFGEPQGAYAYMQAADGETFLCIKYDAAYIQLTDLPEELADKGGEVLDSMTDEDKVDDLNVNSVWIKQDPQGLRKVRGVGIGASREQVLSAFLNFSDQYEDGVLYIITDVNPEWSADWTASFVGGRVTSGQDAAVPVIRAGVEGDMAYTLEPVDCDEVIEYTYVNDFEDYPLEGPGQWNTYVSVRFFVKDGSVIGIYQFRFTDPE